MGVMEIPKDYLAKMSQKPKTGARSHREELLQYFHSKLRNREDKPFRYAHIAKQLKPFTTSAILALKKRCDEYESQGKPFGKCFWGTLRNKRQTV